MQDYNQLWKIKVKGRILRSSLVKQSIEDAREQIHRGRQFGLRFSLSFYSF